MAVTFILGRAGSGKTHHCIQALLRALAAPAETRRLILLVPEQASFQMERTLATQTPAGGYCRAEVLSFSRLARRVLGQTGAEPTILSGDARRLALRRVVAQAGPQLQVLRRAAQTQGFVTQLDRLIEELLREDVTPTALHDAAAQLADAAAARKIQEIARLYRDYLAWLGPERFDPASRLALLRARLAELDWLPSASIWVDGFAGFTGQELQTLVELAGRARDMHIALLLDPAAPAVQNPRQPPDPLGLFQRTEATYQRLHALLAEAGIVVQPPVTLPPTPAPRFRANPALAALEHGLATPEKEHRAQVAPGGVRLIECPTQRAELRAAARWIRTMIADAGGALHYRDFAVIARDLTPLAETVAEVFAEYEIPYFLDCRRAMRAHPLSRLLPALLDAVTTDFSVEALTRLLRTRLLPLSRDEAEQLENLIVNTSISGLTAWRRPEWELERVGQTVAACAPQRARIVAALEPLVTLGQAKDATGAAWAPALYQALVALGVPQRIEQWIQEARAGQHWESLETHRLAWSALCGVLDDLHAVLGDTPLSAADVTAILGTTLSELTLGLAPPTIDQVLVSSIERSRHPDIQHAWVVAFNEGIFPPRPPDDLLLSAAERIALQAAHLPAPASHRDDALGERLLAYIALTRPSQSLTISYATAADDGSELMPSPLLADVRQALPGLAATPTAQHEPPVCVGELAREYLAVHRDASQQRAALRYERLCEHVQALPALAGPLAWLLGGRDYDNRPAPLGNFRRPKNAAENVIWDGSPSEVETYLACPFKHFARHGLRLDAARGPRPLRWDLGDIAHEILARVTQRGRDEPGGARNVSDERWQQLLTEALDEQQRKSPADQAARRPDLVFMRDVLAGFLRDVVAAHAARWQRGQFEPLRCEWGFAPQAAPQTLRALELALPDGQRVHLHGKIDRVDACHTGKDTWLLVYDYKSARVDPLRGTFLTGQRLQLLIYLLAVREAHRADPHLRLAGVMLAPLYPTLKALENKYASAAPRADQLMYLFRPRGVLDEAVAPLLDRQLGTTPSPVAALQLRKDGGFHAHSDTVSADRLAAYLDLAARTVLYAAEGVGRGGIDIAPLVEKRTLACRACDFADVCRFDRLYNTPRAAETALPTLPAEPATAEELE
ncbi:MAG TPA: exodeoxyribonuclease V subunit gamma [Phycisphaerae bacterium]|nr:exodeoxyribonuclease V subunit gamma [Phycisphaerae bacterium]